MLAFDIKTPPTIHQWSNAPWQILKKQSKWGLWVDAIVTEFGARYDFSYSQGVQTVFDLDLCRESGAARAIETFRQPDTVHRSRTLAIIGAGTNVKPGHYVGRYMHDRRKNKHFHQSLEVVWMSINCSWTVIRSSVEILWLMNECIPAGLVNLLPITGFPFQIRSHCFPVCTALGLILLAWLLNKEIRPLQDWLASFVSIKSNPMNRLLPFVKIAQQVLKTGNWMS
jgi:hypothetical protein